MTITGEFKQEVKDYCGISGTDSDTQVETLIQAADEFLLGAVGIYPTESNRAKTMIKIIVNDFFGNREYNESTRVSANTRKLIDSMILQLQMEIRKAAETAVI